MSQLQIVEDLLEPTITDLEDKIDVLESQASRHMKEHSQMVELVLIMNDEIKELQDIVRRQASDLYTLNQKIKVKKYIS